MTTRFIGRKKELERLTSLSSLKRPILAVIMGRRRIGKSRLAAEFGKDKIFIPFAGIAPVDGSTAQDQREAFARQFYSDFKIAPLSFNDWSDAFDNLTAKLTQKPTVILLDEISWMGYKDPLFIPKLKHWWDSSLQKFPNLTVILCGSVSIWIEENIIKSTALFGRVSLKIALNELSLSESATLLKKSGFKGSDYEIIKILSVTGGIPWYLEQIDPKFSADENISRLFFDKMGLFYKEYEYIFHDLFENRGAIYSHIVEKLASGIKSITQLKTETNYSNSGAFSKYMKNLVISGFVDEHYSWSFKSGQKARQVIYRLKDNYLRFYIKYLAPKVLSPNKNYDDISLENLPGWATIIGLQVENLLLNNRSQLIKLIGVSPSEIIADNPYQQKATKALKGCQIDYLIQTRAKNLYLCEFKFSRKEIEASAIESIKTKIKALKLPRGIGICPILVHISGVNDNVDSANFFYRIIDMHDILNTSSDN